MSKYFAYDTNQNPTLQPALGASAQAFLNSTQTTSVAAGSTGINVNTFTGSGVLDVASTASFDFQTTPTANVLRYIYNSQGGISPANIQGFLYVTTSAGVALLAVGGFTATSFTNVTYITGQEGTLTTGGAVANAAQGLSYLETGVGSRICGSVFSDQGGTLALLQSFDGVNWDIANNIAVTANTVNAGINQEVIAPYLSYLYSNGTVAQTVLRLHLRVFSNGRQGA